MAFEIKDGATHSRIVEDLKSWIDRIEQSRVTLDELNLDNWNNYNSVTDKVYYEGDANIFVPVCFMLVETLVARIIASIFAEDIPVPLMGMGPDDKNSQDRIRALLHQQQKSQVKLKRKFTEYVRSRCIFTKAYAKICWRTEYRTIKKRVLEEAPDPLVFEQQEDEDAFLDVLDPDFAGAEEGETLSGLPEVGEDADLDIGPESDQGHQTGLPDHPKAKWTVKEERVPTYDCWDIQVKDYFNMGVDPLAENDDIQQARFMYERSFVSSSELMLMASEEDPDGEKKYKMLSMDSYEGAKGQTFDDDYIIDKKRLIGLDVSVLDKTKNAENEDMHEIHTCYYTTPFSNGAYPEKHAVFTLLNRTYLIQAEKNPWFHGMIPYISGSTFPRPKEFEGQSVCSVARTQQYETNAKRNQALDADTFSMMQMIFAGAEAGIEDNQFTASQNGVIHCDDVNQIKPMVFPSFSQNGYQAEAFLKNDVRESTGITEALQGVDGTGPRQTAFQVGQKLSQGSERLKLILEEVGTNEWPQLFEMAHYNNQQFLTKDTFLRLTEREKAGFKFFGNPNDTKNNDQEEKVTLKDISMPVDFVGSDFQERELENIRNQKIVDFFQLVQSFPESPENRSFFNIVLRKVWTKVLRQPVEDLYDDNGDPILLTQPGAKSLFDTKIQEKSDLDAQNSLLQQEMQAQTPEGAPASQVPGGNVEGLSDQDIAALSEFGA
jgi:hypothetical protein